MNIAQFIVSILILGFLIVDKVFLSKHLERKQDIIDNQSTLVDDVTKSLGLIKEGKEAEIKMKEMTIKEMEGKIRQREDAALFMLNEWRAVMEFVIDILYSVPLNPDILEKAGQMKESAAKTTVLQIIDNRQKITLDALRMYLETDSKYSELIKSSTNNK